MSQTKQSSPLRTETHSAALIRAAADHFREVTKMIPVWARQEKMPWAEA